MSTDSAVPPAPPATADSAARERATDPPSRGWRTVRIVAVLAVLAVVGLGAVFGSRIGKDPTLVQTPLIGKPVPPVTLPFLERKGSVSLAELRGKVVVVNFWASWCVACRKEHPALMAANEAYRLAGVVFVGVDYQDQRPQAVSFLDEMGRGAGYQYVTDPGSRAALEFGVFGVPETFFVDRSGTVVAKITGASTLPLLSSTLDAIIAGRRPPSGVVGTVRPSPPNDGDQRTP